jgi:hypothetical protein
VMASNADRFGWAPWCRRSDVPSCAVVGGITWCSRDGNRVADVAHAVDSSGDVGGVVPHCRGGDGSAKKDDTVLCLHRDGLRAGIRLLPQALPRRLRGAGAASSPSERDDNHDAVATSR